MELSIAKLKAARKMTAAEDIRYYLCGVCLRADAMYATNGHYLIRIHDAGATAEKDIIIPNEALDNLFKKLKTPAYKKIETVALAGFADNGSLAFRVGDMALEVFKPVDGTFPDVERVIPLPGGKEAPGNYNWSYLTLFDEAYAQLLGGSVKFANVRLQQFGPTSAALVHFDKCTDALGVIMPLLHK